jgi:DNA-binding NtrC family response regulator
MDVKAFQEKYGLLGDSPEIKQIITKIGQVAPTDITILLQGETGVGKDVTARAIHGLSERKKKNLVIVNCGAIPEGIIESELFGHEKGAFTGAHDAREGYFEKAHQGTIFLDEIGDTPKNVQVKLLRVLESGEFFRVGSSELKTTNVRVIAATNKNLWNHVQDGSFREDLYYRLDTVKIKLPPLRERKDDIIPLFRKFVSEYAAKYDSVFQGFADDARQLLISYRWPGNIRELRNVAEQLAVLEKSNFITVDILKKYLKGRQHEGNPDNLPALRDPLHKDNRSDSDSDSRDRELIYRALIDLKAEVNDMKKMLAGLVYSNFTGKEIRGMLPANVNMPSEEQFNNKEESRGTVQSDISLGVNRRGDDSNSASEIPGNDAIDYSEEFKTEFESMLDDGDVPSIEDAEKFLIERALTKYSGNRRKASEALGVSERTLYRKLDQYGLHE